MRIEPAPQRRAKTGGRRNSGAKPPNVPTADQVLFVLMRHPRQWFVAVETLPSGDWGALAVALHRRGCEVRRLLGSVQFRWTHEVPTTESLVRVVRPLASPRNGEVA